MTTLPFGEFLEALRDKGFAIGLHEYIALGKLLERWDRTDRGEIRDGLAALIARNEDEVREIGDAFDKFYPLAPVVESRAGSGAGTGQKFTLVRLVRRSAPWAALLVVVAAVAFGLLRDQRERSQLDPARSPQPSVSPVPPSPSSPGNTPAPASVAASYVVYAKPPEPDPPPAVPIRTDWSGVSWLAAAVVILTTVALWGARMRAAARQWTADAWRSELADLPGPFHGTLVMKDLVTRLPRADVEDAATVLSRSFSSDWRGNELDVPRSLRETLRFGMQPHLIFKPRRVQEAILVLRDISQSMEVHARKVESLNTDLRRQGVVMEHWFFDGDVALQARRPFGMPVPLAQLFRSRVDGPTLILSAGAGVPASLERPEKDWLFALRNRARLAWVNPITDPRLWPSAMQRLPVLVLPMTRTGLLHAANALAHGDYPGSRALSRITTSRPVTTEHVNQLRRLASIVPYPTPEFLELLRQRFAPAVPESAVLYAVDAKSASANLPFKMTDDEIRESLRQVRSETPLLERQVREYLIKVLDDSEPQPGSAAHLRWQASRAIHQVQLGELKGADAAAAADTLRQIYNGPLWEEVKEIIGRQPSTSPAMNQLRAAVRLSGRKAEPPAFVARPDSPPAERFRWVAPGWRAALVATAVAAVVAVVAAWTSPYRLQASHRPGAYTLEYIPTSGKLAIHANGASDGMQQTVQLYRDGAVWGNPVALSGNNVQSIAIEEDQAHVYQARLAMPTGAVALSNSIFAPTVTVLIDAQPWARVRVFNTSPASEVMLTEQPTTPVAIQLPLGSYEVRLENGGVTQNRDERIDVTRAGTRTFQFTMPGFNADALVNQLSGSTRKSAKY